MKDEEYVFYSDVSEKANIRRSARNKRSHCGKGGRVRLPSDNLTKEEIAKMSGECISFRLNEPMTWAEFKALPDDIKVMYIKLLKEKWKVPDHHIGKMMGVGDEAVRKVFSRLGFTKGHGGRVYWDMDGFYAWIAGFRAAEEPVAEEGVETPVEEPEVEEVVWRKVETSDDPFVNPNAIPECNPVPETSVPTRGQLEFKCPADVALDMVKNILANEMVEMRVSWRVIDGSDC